MIPLDVHVKVIYKPIGWSMFRCPYCDGIEVMQVQEIFEVFKIMFVSTGRRSKGYIGRCDLCERLVTTPMEMKVTEQWNRHDGFKKLVERIFPERVNSSSIRNEKARMVSLLESLKNMKIMTRMHGNNLSLLLGGLFGGAAGAFCGYVLYKLGVNIWDMDLGGFMVMTALVGFAAGAVIAGAAWNTIRRKKLAMSRIRKACKYYDIGIESLREASVLYPAYVRSAVDTVHLEMAYGKDSEWPDDFYSPVED
jgi:hypothetical protein